MQAAVRPLLARAQRRRPCSAGVGQPHQRWLARGGRRGRAGKGPKVVVEREMVAAKETEKPVSASVVRRDHPWREEALRQILASRAEDSSLTLWLDSVQDPHNLGACLRTADGAGCCAVVIPSRGSVGLTDTVHAVACGAALAVPLIQVGSMAAAMKRFNEEFGLHFVGTSDKARHTLYDADLVAHQHVALV
jgi:tRNA G18 (ribose-2'-O)-methylase SpoU